MKTIGILGGMSAASTQTYYRELCRLTREKFGGLHSPELLIRSVDFEHIANLQKIGDWQEAGNVLNKAAKALQSGGAELLMIATNTMHKLADDIMLDISIPLIHIADATASAINKQGCKSPALIATAFTMEQPFYRERLIAAGLSPIIPEPDDRKTIHRIIYEELCKDIISENSRETYIEISHRLKAAGADSLILGCTEVGMLLNSKNVPLPVFDTALIHCETAFATSLK